MLQSYVVSTRKASIMILCRIDVWNSEALIMCHIDMRSIRESLTLIMCHIDVRTIKALIMCRIDARSINPDCVSYQCVEYWSPDIVSFFAHGVSTDHQSPILCHYWCVEYRSPDHVSFQHNEYQQNTTRLTQQPWSHRFRRLTKGHSTLSIVIE